MLRLMPWLGNDACGGLRLRPGRGSSFFFYNYRLGQPSAPVGGGQGVGLGEPAAPLSIYGKVSCRSLCFVTLLETILM